MRTDSGRRAAALALALTLALAGGAALAHPVVAADVAASDYGLGEIKAPHEHLPPEVEAAIFRDIYATVDRLTAEGRLARPKADLAVRFAWPVRAAPGRPEFHAYTISNYIDQNPTNGALRDYNCGTRTYDLASGGHKGTDISLGVRPVYKQDTEQVQVVAAAAGAIVARVDGNNDRTCGSLTSLPTTVQANYVSVRHDDGSVALYFHLKRGSLTPKRVGDRVAEGEYLGIVGSSGFSTGPHLHFEVRDAGNAVIDPWVGACNPTSGVSLWKQQEPYYNPQMMEVILSPVAPSNANLYPNACDATTNQYGAVPASGYLQPDPFLVPGRTHYLAVFVRDWRRNESVQFTIRRPDGSVLGQTNVTLTNADYYQQGYSWVTLTLTDGQPVGAWALELQYGGQTRTVPLYFNVPAPVRALVQEFYAPTNDRYFRTANAAEAAGLAGNPGSGWNATSEDFLALERATARAGVAPVCRFYGSFTLGPNSHFYTADPGECQGLRDLAARTPSDQPRWNFEEIAFAVHLPIGGVCPVEAPFPIYRVYNGYSGQIIGGVRRDANHRFTSLLSVYENMKASGWQPEGVVMCAVAKP